MRNNLLAILVLVSIASSCSGSAEIEATQGPASSRDEANAEPAPSVVTVDPSSTPSIFTDGFGDWYVPATGQGTEPERPDPIAGSTAEIVAAINAAVPAGYMLSFRWQDMDLTDDHQVMALAPVEWDKDDDPDDYEYDSRDLDFSTEYEVDTGCQGFCEPQDWHVLMNDPADSPFRVSVERPIVILVDQELRNPSGRLVVSTGSATPSQQGTTYVELVRWSNQADRFLKCTATLGEPDASLWPTFADVCLAATGDWLG